MNEKLYVIAVISNPRRFESRYNLYKDFAKKVMDAGAVLITVELAFGARDFEVTEENNPMHIRIRSPHELWLKENMVNIGMTKLPHDWKYVAWVDADVSFARPDWVVETIHMLQHHDIVQLFSIAQDMSPTHEPFATYDSFVSRWKKGNQVFGSAVSYLDPTEGHPGFAWAATRRAINAVGGLFDTAMLGAGDRHMALAMIGHVDKSIPAGVSDSYKKMIQHWQIRANALKQNIGYVEGLLIHHWHGKKRDRRYWDRRKILVENKFDPMTDIHRDFQGLYQLSEHKPGLRDGIMHYFQSRNEDSIDM
jgi:hypothetical protein